MSFYFFIIKKFVRLWVLIQKPKSNQCTRNVSLLSANTGRQRLADAFSASNGLKKVRAMFSSYLGGVTTDPVSMCLPIDDHGFHRGHAVFDTTSVIGEKVYQLEQHLDRFVRSASLARIPLRYSREEMKGREKCIRKKRRRGKQRKKGNRRKDLI